MLCNNLVLNWKIELIKMSTITSTARLRRKQLKSEMESLGYFRPTTEEINFYAKYPKQFEIIDENARRYTCMEASMFDIDIRSTRFERNYLSNRRNAISMLLEYVEIAQLKKEEFNVLALFDEQMHLDLIGRLENPENN